ncbi:MAG: histidinol-phosphate aminotransferase family protein [Dehalococcoidia bacterium]|nr:histidinol-phosphate aminotransferase family protein [Dehalococcoidia bacterium]
MATSPRHEAAIESCPHGVLSPREARARGLDPGEVLDFSFNVNPYGPPLAVAAAVSRAAIARYPDSDSAELRAALAQRAGVAESQVCVGDGSMELLWLLGLAYLRPGDRALILGPTFGEYARLARIFGAQPVEMVASEAAGWAPDLAALRRALAQGPRLVFLCNPNNPTGLYLKRGLVEEILGLCSQSLLVMDEAFLGFVGSPWPSEPLLERGQVVLVRSLTKDYALAGLRLGYAIGSAQTVAALEAVRPPWSVNALAQAAGLACLEDGQFLPTTRRQLEETKAWLTGELAALGLPAVPSAANFFLLKVGDGAAFRGRLLELGVCVRDCASFGLPQYVRIGVRTPAECRRLLEAIKCR